ALIGHFAERIKRYLVGKTIRKISVGEPDPAIGKVEHRNAISEQEAGADRFALVRKPAQIEIPRSSEGFEPIDRTRDVAVRAIAEGEPAKGGALSGIQRDIKRPLTIGGHERLLRNFSAVGQHA